MSYSSSKREAREPADLDLCFSLSSDSRTTGSGPKEARYLAICEKYSYAAKGGLHGLADSAGATGFA